MNILRKRRTDKVFVEQIEAPKRYDPITKTWIDTSGYVYNKNTGLWEEKWSACPINGIYLYNKGNECTDVTGGWIYRSFYAGSGSNSTGPYCYKNADNIRIYVPGVWTGSQHLTVYTTKGIDLTDYSTLKVMTYATRSGGSIFLSNAVPYYNSRCGRYDYYGPYLKKTPINVGSAYQLHEVDVSDLTGEHYVHTCGELAASQYNLNIYISQIWLEKEEESDTEQVDVSDETT